MAEPEEVLIEAAHAATVRSAALWRRMRPGVAGPPGLEELRERLSLFVEALCPGTPPLARAEPPAVPTWLGRLARRQPAHLTGRAPLATTDGSSLRLPPRFDDGAETAESYRVLALGQALRARRRSSRGLPASASSTLRDLYTIAEAAAIEAEIARLAPGLVPAIERMRARAFRERPHDGVLTRPERGVEAHVRDLLTAPPGTPPLGLPSSGTPVDSLAWAESAEQELASTGGRGRYRGIAPVVSWGHLATSEEGRADTAPHVTDETGDDGPPRATRRARLVRRPRVRQAGDDEDDPKRGPWLAPGSDRQESVEDPMGLNRPTDRDDAADPADFADALAELPEARLVVSPEAPREVLFADDPPPRTVHALLHARGIPGVAYPEWDWKAAAYRPAHVTVRLVPAREGTAAWAGEALHRHRRLVEHTRRHFERLRPRRTPLKRQLDGAEIDLDACVEAHADARTVAGPSERLYVAERPRRRDLSLLVLVDASASTDRWVDGLRDIIDVEKEALLVACEALAVLGDRHAILAFSGEGPGAVHVATLKTFDEPYGTDVRRRIAGLVPERYTRLGAAVRHATSVLGEERATHRMLLVLTDGRPNDVDEYEGRYGVEDARQALLEARAQGMRPYGLAIDRRAEAWLPRLFGHAGFTLLRRVPDLPAALLDVVRRLAGSAP